MGKNENIRNFILSNYRVPVITLNLAANEELCAWYIYIYIYRCVCVCVHVCVCVCVNVFMRV